MTTVASVEFDAVVEEARGGGALVRLPADAAEQLGTKARFPVRASFNGIPYRGSTMPMGDGTFCLGIAKAIRAEAGADVGDTVHVLVERDTGERTVDVPPELAAALRKHPAAARRFERLSYSHRREYAQSVAEAKREETRLRRAGQVVERLLAE